MEKLVGKSKILFDPELMSMRNNKVDFLHSNYFTKKSFFFLKYEEVLLNYLELFFSGWGIIIWMLNSIYSFYLSYLLLLEPYTYKVKQIIINEIGSSFLFREVVGVLVVALALVVLNNLFNVEYQKVMRGKMFFVLFPISGLYRAFQKLPKVVLHGSSFKQKHEGELNRLSKSFFVEQFVCADIKLIGDYKKYFDGLEWQSVTDLKQPINLTMSYLERKINAIIRILVNLLCGLWCGKRKLTLYFKEVPKNGQIEIETY